MPRNASRLPRPAAAETPAAGEAMTAYRRRLVRWYRVHARNLPWRRDPTPYRVWVSEVMLQQTRVETVVPYFERFLERFPDCRALAAAPEEAVLEAWSGLGYYRRARALQAGARAVVARHGGTFPDDEADALALPGVGRYTAGAVRSIALGRRAPVLDGNVTRVLARVFGVDGDTFRAATRRVLWDLAARAVARGEPGEVNQAQMELGALVCRAPDPRCDRCPVAELCVARRTGRVHALPVLPERRPPVEVTRTALLVRHRARILLRRRAAGEALPGMWDLPGAFPGRSGDDASGDWRDASALLPFPVEVGAALGTIRHAVTYRRVVLEVREARPAGGRTGRARTGPDGAELAWSAPDAALERALSSPARRVLRRWGTPP